MIELLKYNTAEPQATLLLTCLFSGDYLFRSNNKGEALHLLKGALCVVVVEV